MDEEQKIMQKFNEEICSESKDQLLVYLQRLKRNEQKHRRKYKRMKKKIKILKERLIYMENQEWAEQLQNMDEN